MDQKILVSYSQSPLRTLNSHWGDSFTIYDEKLNNFSQLEGAELWLDAYIDLYDPKLKKPEYLYQFFARIHQICDECTISEKRILINFPNSCTQSELNKVFYLYNSFTNFFIKAYEVHPIYIPDILNDSYKHHPFNQLKKQTSLPWSQKSIFRVIEGEDIISNILSVELDKKSAMISGIKVSLIDLQDKITQIFGNPPTQIENAYQIQSLEPKCDLILSDLNYNLESALIHQL